MFLVVTSASLVVTSHEFPFAFPFVHTEGRDRTTTGDAPSSADRVHDRHVSADFPTEKEPHS